MMTSTASNRGEVLQEGLWIGLIGYATVALSMGLFDLLAGRPFFHTAALLGSGLLGRPSDAGVAITPDVVFVYNGVHLLAFLLIGVLIAYLVREIELHPMVWYFAFFALLGAFFVSIFLIGLLAEAGGEAVPWGGIVAANLFAVAAIAYFLRPRHPGIWLSMKTEADPEYPSHD